MACFYEGYMKNKQLDLIAQTIFDKKGFNILALDVRGVSTMTDFFMIAEGTVDRHVQALARAIVDKVKEHGISPTHVEGMASGDWVVIDYTDIVIHLFMEDLRGKYALEELWKESKLVDLQIVVPAETKPLRKHV
jgi:ribosome-associated protein